MIRPEQIPPDAWVELVLRLESCGVHVTEQQARLAAVALIEAWPGAVFALENNNAPCILLPLPQEHRDE
ncbi:MAG: hypothetical protein RLZZ09_1098 [Pseudomonadota bacterium]